MPSFASIYYTLKPLIPRRVQIQMRRVVIDIKRPSFSAIWPIDRRSAMPPNDWKGWPQKKRFALVLTHDVDTAKGQANCRNLIHLEQAMGFRSSFNFVPADYDDSLELRHYLTTNGFEVGVHGYSHDGKLYSSWKFFQDQAKKINRHLDEWNSVGFRSPAMHHNLEWLHALQIKYDASTFDTDPFEPQSDGMKTIFPFWVSNGNAMRGYVELPYTLPQDFTLYVLMREKTIDIWKRKLDWIVNAGGMALVNVHPDYMCFGHRSPGLEEYPAKLYSDFLNYVKSTYEGSYWHVLPKEVARHVGARHTLSLQYSNTVCV
jgi:hypothetical protein